MASDPTLGVVISSVRDGRSGTVVADWFLDVARAHGVFDVTPIDLRAIDLPLLKEPAHPRLQQYADEKTRAWSTLVAATDAFVFITPEYNFAMPPALLNALDHLYVEWNYKAAGFVSYGGMSGGMRSVQMTKQVLTSFKMVPLVEAVALPFFAKLVDAGSGAFKPGEASEKSAHTMLKELARWTSALRSLRS